MRKMVSVKYHLLRHSWFGFCVRVLCVVWIKLHQHLCQKDTCFPPWHFLPLPSFLPQSPSISQMFCQCFFFCCYASTCPLSVCTCSLTQASLSAIISVVCFPYVCLPQPPLSFLFKFAIIFLKCILIFSLCLFYFGFYLSGIVSMLAFISLFSCVTVSITFLDVCLCWCPSVTSQHLCLLNGDVRFQRNGHLSASFKGPSQDASGMLQSWTNPFRKW